MTRVIYFAVQLSGSKPFKGFILYAQAADWRKTQDRPMGTFLLTQTIQAICIDEFGVCISNSIAFIKHACPYTSVTKIVIR